MGIDLSVAWFVIIVFATLMYIVMDGFDLGIGILFPFIQDKTSRDVMVNSVAPVWDGNETWLVLGGAALFGAFPLAYAIIIDALTIPLSLMLVGLIFRGVAFEFRFQATPAHRPFWDKSFQVGSILTTFCQGVVVGAVISGFQVTGRQFSGGQLDWFTPFNLFCGLGLVITYALLGATWLVMKSEDPLQQQMRSLTPKLLLILLAIFTIISIWTPLQHTQIAERWFSTPNLYYLLPVPVCVLLFSGLLWRTVARPESSHALPFIFTLGLVFLGFSGLGISIWPNIIPPSISLWDAAAPAQSQGFMLVGTLFILPFILMYSFWSYYVFRGKVRHGEGYH